MKRTILFCLAVFVVVGAAVFIATSVTGRHYEGNVGSQAAQRLEWEARLVNHFCLNRIPPLGGREAIPSEWASALGSTVSLRQGAGEVVGDYPFLKPRSEEIRGLAVGKSLQVSTGQGSDVTHVIVYRPNLPGGQLLVISKSGASLATEIERPSLGPLAWALFAGLAGTLVLAILRRWLWGAPPRP